MSLKPNFSNGENWELLGNISGVSHQDPQGAIYPIAPLIYPVLLTSKTLLIYSHSENASDTWKFGGVATMKINPGVVVGGNFDTHGISGRKLYLNQLTLVKFPDIANEYALEIAPPKWFLNVTYTIYQYIGTGIPNLEGKIDEIHSLTGTLTQKVDNLQANLTTLQNDFDAYTGL